MADEHFKTFRNMASAFTVPLMSTLDSTQSLRSHSRTHSHQRSSQRLARPFALPRIPSESLDPRSGNLDHRSRGHESGQKRGEHGIVNRASFGANGSMSAPSIYTNGQFKGISKPPEVATQSHELEGTSHSQLDGLPRADGKAEINATKMGSKPRWAFRNPQGWLNMLTIYKASQLPTRNLRWNPSASSVHPSVLLQGAPCRTILRS